MAASRSNDSLNPRALSKSIRDDARLLGRAEWKACSSDQDIAGPIEDSSYKNETTREVRPSQGYKQSNGGAITHSEQRCRATNDPLQKFDCVLSHQLVSDRAVGVRRSAMASSIHRVDLKAGSEVLEIRPKRPGIDAARMQQHERFPSPEPVVPGLHAVQVDVTPTCVFRPVDGRTPENSSDGGISVN
jgi:hypothetical protein